ncbi:MAG: ornithine--oxo-acid transaminase [Gammaproteobacteria bacterium]|nr:MAG: ornithine--oxo-acid transaminase [Gammaproteobacteria bacterium]
MSISGVDSSGTTSQSQSDQSDQSVNESSKAASNDSDQLSTNIRLESQYCAANYSPLPVVLSRGEGVYVWDENDRRYLDMMSAYSAVSHGHCNPRLVKALQDQAAVLGVVSRAFFSEGLGTFLQKACAMTGYQQALPMNTGAEAVETALKAARKWAYQKKGVADNKAEIIVCENNFHGRTIAVVGMSSEPQYRDGFGPFPAGVTIIPYADAAALEAAITDNTAAFLVEPIQGEGGILIPPQGYLAECARLCKKHNVLLICDEVQTGLGRTGKLLACEHDGVKPDGVILGKALGGGLLPVSLFLADDEVMSVFTPGDHGSTFGGYPLAARVGLEALRIIEDDGLTENSATLGDYFLEQLRAISHPSITDVRGKGLFIGVELDPKIISARTFCEMLMEEGILSKDTHHTVARFAPPLVINKEQLDWAIEKIKLTFERLD